MPPITHHKNIAKLVLCLLTAAILVSAQTADALEKSEQGHKTLLDTYQRNLARLETSSFGLPLAVDSAEFNDQIHVDVYGIFAHPFSNMVNVLQLPANWCDIVSLHPNIKACTASDIAGAWELTFYLGRKGYHPPQDSRPVIYRFGFMARQEQYIDINLNTDDGPFGTKKHKMRFEALPLEGERTFVHVSYGYRDSAALRLAAKVFFATVSRGMTGFSVTGTDRKGNPVYIGGPRGAVERSAVRYYLAIQAFLDTLHLPLEKRATGRINAWYLLTSRYGKQLLDMGKEEYLTAKTRERQNQIKLQQQIDREPVLNGR